MAEAIEQLSPVLGEYLAAEGIELDDLELVGFGRNRRLRVVVDGPGVDLGRIADVSRGISGLLDAADLIQGSYALEVTTPGLERKLRTPRHFTKSIGREVVVKGLASHRGILVAADAEGFELTEGDARVRVSYQDVHSASTVFAWEPSQPKAAKGGQRAWA